MASTSTLNNQKNAIGAQIQAQGGRVQIRHIQVNVNNRQEVPDDAFDLPKLIDTFHGREEEFSKLDNLFFSRNKCKVVIHGLPGYGKTELSKQYAQKCLEMNQVKHIFWIKAENEDELILLSPNLKLTYKQMEGVSCLYVFDNAVNRRSVCDYEPSSHKHKMLITSHVRDWGHGVVPLQLSPLTSKPVVNIFKTILEENYNEQDRDLYVELAQAVDNVPLGIQVVAGYVRQRMHCLGRSFKLSDCVDEMKQSKQKIINNTFSKDNPNPYKHSIYGALTVSLNKLKEEEDIKRRELAVIVLYMCAFLDPEVIVIEQLLEVPIIIELIEDSKVELKSAIGLLINFSFVNYGRSDEAYIKIHRLIQSFLRQYLCSSHVDEKCYTACVYSLLCIHNYYTTRSVLSHPDVDIVQECVGFLKHVFQNSNKTAKDWIDEHNLCYHAASEDQIVILELLLQHADINVTNDECTFQLLSSLVKNDRLELLESLLQQDVNINSRGSDNYTVLHVAAVWGKVEAIRRLLNHGADVTAQSYRCETAPFELIRCLEYENRSDKHKHSEILDLLNREEHPRSTNLWGSSLLHVAAEKAHADLAELLIERYGCDVNKQNDEGNTPLHEVIGWLYTNSNEEEVVRTVQTLIRCGAKLDIENCRQETPLHLLERHIKLWHHGEYLIQYLTPSDAEPEFKFLRLSEDVGNNLVPHATPSETKTNSCNVI